MNDLKKFAVLYSSLFSKRDKDLFVFGSWFGNKFADNPKYLYLYFLKKGKNAIWITKSKDVLLEMQKDKLPVYMADSKEGIMACKKAKYVFYSVSTEDVNHLYIGGAILINLWHGIPLKKIGFDNKLVDNNKSFRVKIGEALYYLPYIKSYIVSTSDTITEIYKSAFKKNKKHILQLGQPRNDCFFDGSLKKRCYSNVKYEKLIVYLPTHRNEGKTKMPLDSIFDLEILNDLCVKYNALFLIKKHYYNSKEEFDDSPYSNIVDFTNITCDTQELLYNADVLITDYSSCYIDYLLMDKPMLFYAYDYNDYLINDREMYFVYDEVTPGPISKDFDSFINDLKTELNGQSLYSTKISKIKDLFYSKNNQGMVSEHFIDSLPK